VRRGRSITFEGLEPKVKPVPGNFGCFYQRLLSPALSSTKAWKRGCQGVLDGGWYLFVEAGEPTPGQGTRPTGRCYSVWHNPVGVEVAGGKPAAATGLKPKEHAPRRCVNPQPRTAAPRRALGSLAFPFPNPNGIPPSTRRRDYPGKRKPTIAQPQRGCGQNDVCGNGHNPVGVEGNGGQLPRVVAPLQPWAGRCNPVGVGAGN
jgi:hypothetical protein